MGGRRVHHGRAAPRGRGIDRPTLGAAPWVLIVCLLVQACRPTPPAPPSPSGSDIVRRHWDQACQPRGAPPAALRITELFDTTGLGGELEEKGLRVPTRVGQRPQVDFVSRYGADGRLVTSGSWESTVPAHLTDGITEVLRSRARSPVGLLEPEGFRVRLTLTPWPILSLAPAVECMPHMIHRDGEPPVGLPDTVRTWAGSTRVREGDDSTVTVNILIDERGSVVDVTKHGGSEQAFDAARDVIRQLRFDPPLRNGEPVRAWLRQSFRFRRTASG